MQADETPRSTAFIASVQLVLDAQAAPAAVLDSEGAVVAANAAWLEITGGDGGVAGLDENQLALYDRVKGEAEAPAGVAADPIKALLAGEDDEVEIECNNGGAHGRLRAVRLVHDDNVFVIVSRRDFDKRADERQDEKDSSGQPSQLERLAAASVEIAAAGSPEATLQVITDQARLVIPSHLAATHNLASNVWPEATVAVSLSDSLSHYRAFAVPPNGSGIYSEVVRSGRPLRLTQDRLSKHPAWRSHGEHRSDHPPLRSLLAAPMCSRDGGCFGVIMLSEKVDGEFTAEDEAILVQLAQMASVCIRNALDARAHVEAQDRLEATQEHANIAIGECDAEGRYVRVNTGFTSLTGFDQKEIVGRTFFEFTDPADLDAERARHREQLAGNVRAYSLEKRFRHKDGTARWALLSASAVFDAQGTFLYAIRVLQDIDQRKRNEERQAAQVRELHHRVRNTLAIVQGIMGASARSSEDFEAFKSVFSARLAAIARAHTLLTTDDWQTASLKEMIEAEIAASEPKAEQRVAREGPPVDLPVNLAIALSMALHELLDNALRHGALSSPEGKVNLRWSLRHDSGPPMLTLEWAERGGPEVMQPTHKGYGSILLTKVLPVQANSTTSIDFDSTGLLFRLEAQLEAAP